MTDFVPIPVQCFKWKLHLDPDGYINEIPENLANCLMQFTCNGGSVHYVVMRWNDKCNGFEHQSNGDLPFKSSDVSMIEFIQLETLSSD